MGKPLLPHLSLWAGIALEMPSPCHTTIKGGSTHMTLHSAGEKQHLHPSNPGGGHYTLLSQVSSLCQFSPLAFSSLGDSNCQGCRLCFLKNSLTISTPTEAQERSRCFFSSIVIQWESGVGQRVICQSPSGKYCQTWGSPTSKCMPSPRQASFFKEILTHSDDTDDS